MYYFSSLVSALLFIHSFPFKVSGYMALISLVPLFISLSIYQPKTKIAASGALFGFFLSLYLSIPLYQSLTLTEGKSLVLPALLIFLTLIAPNMVFYSLFGLFFRWNSKTYSKSSVLIPGSLWILIDYLKETLPFPLPWGFAGYTQVFTPFIQVADIAGVHGVTFIIITINALIAQIILDSIKLTRNEFTDPGKEDHIRSGMISSNTNTMYNSMTLIIVIASALLYGIPRKENVKQTMSNGHVLSYLMIQGNSESIDRWNESTSMSRYQTYARLTEKEIKNADLVIWPETVLNSSDKINFEIMTGVSALLNDGSYFITGAIRRDNNGNTFNSIFVFNKRSLQFIYDKRILFPYSERPFFGKTAGRFFNSPEKFHEGKSPGVYKIVETTAGFSICFEAIYPSKIRKDKNSGAAVQINVANDSWFGDSSVPYLQEYSVITRAVENRTAFLRCANSGISLAVSPAGDVISEIPLNTQNISLGFIPVSPITTIYSKTGNIIIIIAVMLILLRIFMIEFKENKIS